MDNPNDDKGEEQDTNPRLVRPDLCMDGDNSSDRENILPQPSEETPRREENPFSFKRFLNQDCRGGARRKEYSTDGTPILHTPEMSSVLPDFVQDHLIVEQCYMPQSTSHHGPMSFDLPRPSEDRIDPAIAMSLPDFLSDGLIHSQRCEGGLSGYGIANEPGASNGHQHSPVAASWSDSDRLQREVDSLRRQVHEKTRKIQSLESQISLLHSHDNSLEKALEHAENNFRQTTRRMAVAENTIEKLKIENKMLKTRLESPEVSAECGGVSSSFPHYQNHRLGQDLRGAASAAEVHLRALMNGIDNLRLLASKVENSTYFNLDDTDTAGATACDLDADGAAGPAM